MNDKPITTPTKAAAVVLRAEHRDNTIGRRAYVIIIIIVITVAAVIGIALLPSS
jgi:hypothetical protein